MHDSGVGGRAPPCIFFANGNCTKGALCQFTHVASVSRPSNAPCKFFQDGLCRNGDTCRFQHVLLSSPPPVPTDEYEEPLSCGICYETIVMKGDQRLGLLENCDHVFCLDCIRSWRRTAETDEKQKNNCRSCPVCRTESYFVIPADRKLVGEEKQNEQEGYKASMNEIPCKFWNFGHGDCNFGSSCFYAHCDENGTRYVAPRVRSMMSEDGTSHMVNHIKLGDFLQPRGAS